MSIIYEIGREYVARDGRVMGALAQNGSKRETHATRPFKAKSGSYWFEYDDRGYAYDANVRRHDLDLVDLYAGSVVLPADATADARGLSGEGRKDDTGKEPFELIAPEFLFATARVLGFGAKKYAPRNWEKGMAWGRVFGALMRHMWAWWAGAGPTTKNFVFGELDAETGFSHLWHASCCLSFLVAYEERGTGTDDRWKGGA